MGRSPSPSGHRRRSRSRSPRSGSRRVSRNERSSSRSRNDRYGSSSHRRRSRSRSPRRDRRRRSPSSDSPRSSRRDRRRRSPSSDSPRSSRRKRSRDRGSGEDRHRQRGNSTSRTTRQSQDSSKLLKRRDKADADREQSAASFSFNAVMLSERLHEISNMRARDEKAVERKLKQLNEILHPDFALYSLQDGRKLLEKADFETRMRKRFMNSPTMSEDILKRLFVEDIQDPSTTYAMDFFDYKDIVDELEDGFQSGCRIWLLGARGNLIISIYEGEDEDLVGREESKGEKDLLSLDYVREGLKRLGLDTERDVRLHYNDYHNIETIG